MDLLPLFLAENGRMWVIQVRWAAGEISVDLESDLRRQFDKPRPVAFSFSRFPRSAFPSLCEYLFARTQFCGKPTIGTTDLLLTVASHGKRLFGMVQSSNPSFHCPARLLRGKDHVSIKRYQPSFGITSMHRCRLGNGGLCICGVVGRGNLSCYSCGEQRYF